MATKEQTRLERDITIIEQTLRAMIEIDPAAIQILSEDSQQSRGAPPNHNDWRAGVLLRAPRRLP